MEFHMINITYAELHMRAQTEKIKFSCKDDYTLTKHTGRWTYSAGDFEIPLCRIPPLRSFFLTFSHPRTIGLNSTLFLSVKRFIKYKLSLEAKTPKICMFKDEVFQFNLAPVRSLNFHTGQVSIHKIIMTHVEV